MKLYHDFWKFHSWNYTINYNYEPKPFFPLDENCLQPSVKTGYEAWIYLLQIYANIYNKYTHILIHRQGSRKYK